jgi:hypothetical protein
VWWYDRGLASSRRRTLYGGGLDEGCGYDIAGEINGFRVFRWAQKGWMDVPLK